MTGYLMIKIRFTTKTWRHREMTMKLNINFEIKNLTSGLPAQYSLPTRLCFVFFSHRTKILKFYGLPKLVHLPLPPAIQANTRAKSKESIFSNILKK